MTQAGLITLTIPIPWCGKFWPVEREVDLALHDDCLDVRS